MEDDDGPCVPRGASAMMPPVASLSLALRTSSLPQLYGALPRSALRARGPSSSRVLEPLPSRAESTPAPRLVRDAVVSPHSPRQPLNLGPLAWLVPSMAAGWLLHSILGLRRGPRKAVAQAGRAAAPGAAALPRPSLVWFRSDLRLHDHEPLQAAMRDGSALLAVYCLDPREFGQSSLGGGPSSGPQRSRFILESLAVLRERLRELGGELLVREGRPEEVLPALVRDHGLGTVHCYEQVAQEDCQVEARVRAAVAAQGGTLRTCWGGTLHHRDDLPFAVQAMPRSYADFHRHMSAVPVRSPIPSPSSINGVPLNGAEPGAIPTLRQLGFPEPPAAALPSTGGALTFSSSSSPSSAASAALAARGGVRGGEAEALRVLDRLLLELKSRAADGLGAVMGHHRRGGRPAISAAETFSCQLSPWLAMGCLSARTVFHELQRALGGAGGTAAGGTGDGGGGAAVGGLVAEATAMQTSELGRREFFCFMVKAMSEDEAARGKGQLAGAAHGAAPCFVLA